MTGPYEYMPGVPAAGHITNGFWHPGAINGCRKCPEKLPPPPPGVIEYAPRIAVCQRCGVTILLHPGELWWEDVRGFENGGTLTFCYESADGEAMGHRP